MNLKVHLAGTITNEFIYFLRFFDLEFIRSKREILVRK